MAHCGMKRVALVVSVGVGSFFTGVYLERRSLNSPPNLKTHFDLPIFGRVLAASPVSHVPTESNAARISQIMKHGFPSYDSLRSFDNYVLSYDRRNRVPNWVFEHIKPEDAKANDGVDRSQCEFKPDEAVHPYFRALNSDYLKSGYDRGHLAAAGNHRSCQKLVEQTFYLSNIAPQVGVGFNRDSWNRLERHVRKLTKVYKNVYCCTGPLYLPKRESDGKNYVKFEVIGANHVAVPTHFFKVVVCETNSGEFEMESYVMPNQVISNDTPLTVFQVTPEIIERASGLLLFDNISRHKFNKVNGKKH